MHTKIRGKFKISSAPYEAGGVWKMSCNTGNERKLSLILTSEDLNFECPIWDFFKNSRNKESSVARSVG